MATGVMILGESGTGKSASLRNLPVESTAIIKIVDKPLPFKGSAKYKSSVSDDAAQIISGISKLDKSPWVKVLVIDDFQYLMANEWMRSLMEKQTKDSEFMKYKSIGYNAWSVIRACLGMRSDIIVFILSHTEQDQYGKVKIKTVGKLLDEKITLEGLVSICLHTKVREGGYFFQTQNDGNNTVKSPIGLFSEVFIPNDLQMVVESINQYSKEL